MMPQSGCKIHLSLCGAGALARERWHHSQSTRLAINEGVEKTHCSHRTQSKLHHHTSTRAGAPAPHLLAHVNLLVHKLLIVLIHSSELKRIRRHSFALFHAGDEIGTPNPVCLGKVSLRPACRMVRMRVIKADDVLSPFPPFPLNAHQFTRIDVIAVLRRVGASISAAHNRRDRARISIHLAEQHATALVRIGLFAVAANFLVSWFANSQHGISNFVFPTSAVVAHGQSGNRKSHPSSQNLSLKYLSPESQKMVTNTAGSSFFNFCATCRHPTTAAAAEIPTSSPSSRANRFAMTYASSVAMPRSMSASEAS